MWGTPANTAKLTEIGNYVQNFRGKNYSACIQLIPLDHFSDFNKSMGNKNIICLFN